MWRLAEEIFLRLVGQRYVPNNPQTSQHNRSPVCARTGRDCLVALFPRTRRENE